MVKAHTPRALALLICKAVYELKGSDPHWASVGEVSKKLGMAHSEAMNIALAYGSQEGLLACSPPPTHSIMLTPKGEAAARAKMKRN